MAGKTSKEIRCGGKAEPEKVGHEWNRCVEQCSAFYGYEVEHYQGTCPDFNTVDKNGNSFEGTKEN